MTAILQVLKAILNDKKPLLKITICVVQHRFRNFDTLTGETHKARFGISVANLGDINLDGFQGKTFTFFFTFY